MTSLSSAETINANIALERFAATHSICIKQYHTNNCRFADNTFKQHCQEQRQAISHCGIITHFQNWITERAFRDITEASRTILLYAKARCPSDVHLNLWPYAIITAGYVHIAAPILHDGRSSIELSSDVNIGFRMKDNHAYRCPVFALQNHLISGKSIPKCSPRSCLGLNLGPNQNHTQNINLVLNLNLGLVSPQFYWQFDAFF